MARRLVHSIKHVAPNPILCFEVVVSNLKAVQIRKAAVLPIVDNHVRHWRWIKIEHQYKVAPRRSRAERRAVAIVAVSCWVAAVRVRQSRAGN